jgi:hypothetical protein
MGGRERAKIGGIESGKELENEPTAGNWAGGAEESGRMVEGKERGRWHQTKTFTLKSVIGGSAGARAVMNESHVSYRPAIQRVQWHRGELVRCSQPPLWGQTK